MYDEYIGYFQLNRQYPRCLKGAFRISCSTARRHFLQLMEKRLVKQTTIVIVVDVVAVVLDVINVKCAT